MQRYLTSFDDSASGWERALMAFLAEKQRRSGSERTTQAYSRMLQAFFGGLGKPPDEVTGPEVFTWAHGRGPTGREPSAVTIGARMACLSSFYRFLIRMNVVAANPCDALERPRIQPSPPKGLSAEEVRRLLAAVPETKAGLRDRALILTLALTGRRRSEVLGLRRCDLSEENGAVYYAYRGKGGKRGKRELPRPALEAIERALGAWGTSLAALRTEASLWPTTDARRTAQVLGVSSGTFYGSLRRYLQAAGLPPSGVHVLRHAAAKLRRDAGESVEEVSAFLDHSSLQVTTVYLRRLEGQEDRSWRRVAAAIGV